MNKHRFQAVYVEEGARSYDLCRQIIGQCPGCPVIPIRHYKDVFNRSNQSVRWQKAYPSLILAVKDEPFLYPGARICQRFGSDRFYYSHMLLGCPFDCSYCYLQGLYPSGHLIVFVNLDDYARSFTTIAREPTYLALSHDADLLALNGLFPCLDMLAQLLDPRLPLLAEIRTKSACRSYFQQHDPFPCFIFAFSLAPDVVIRNYERRTPSLQARLAAVKTALARGFAVRLCFDPILMDPAIDDAYDTFFASLFRQINPDQIVDVSYGFFRMADPLYRRIARLRPNNSLYQAMNCDADGIRTYDADVRQAAASRHMKLLHQAFGPDRVFLA